MDKQTVREDHFQFWHLQSEIQNDMRILFDMHQDRDVMLQPFDKNFSKADSGKKAD